MKSTNITKLKREYLISLFKNLEAISYGVLDIDDNLNKKILNDIDIWVNKKDLKVFVDALYSHSKSEGWIIKKMNTSPRISGFREAKYAILLPAYPFPVIQIDLWVDFHWRSFPILNCDLDNFISRFSYFKKIDIEASIYIQSVKDILYKGFLSQKIKKRIEDNYFTIKDFNFFFNKYYSKKIQNQLKKSISLDEEVIGSKNFKISVIICNLIYRPYSQLINSFIYFLGLIKSKILSQDGIHIILMGPDGAGKTTIGSILLESSIANEYYEKKIYGHTNFKIIPPLQFFLKKFKKKSNNVKYVARDVKKLSLFRAIIYPLYYLFDYLLGHLWLYKRKTNGGAFIIFDRYFDEYYIQKTFNNLPRFFLKILELFIPKPTYYFLISDKPESIYKRKQELSLEQIREQVKDYTELIYSKKNGYVIKNNKTPFESANEILSIISANNKLKIG